MIEFSLNEYVLVKLNNTGIDILKENHTRLRSFYPSIGKFTLPVTDEDGWSKWQLWVLINTFGDRVNMGVTSPFEINIKIDAKVNT
jgi:hypothetical protein